MDFTGPSFILVSALLIGITAGYFVRKAQLCTFAAVENLIFGADTRRMKAFALALGIAMAIAQGMILAGLLDVGSTSFLAGGTSALAITLGGFMFGLGMALVGTCAFGCLIRLGGGDLRSLFAILIIGIVSFAALFGTLAGARLFLSQELPLHASFPADLPGAFAAAGLEGSRAWITAALAGLLILWAVTDRRLWAARRLLIAGAVLGLLIAASWIVTGVLPDPMASEQMPQSLTFVSPLAKGMFGALYREDTLLAFGTLSAFGVVIGAFIAALRAREFRWDAFDAHQEMQRHILGASLMGFGGAMAGGCTIGQGLSAGSVLALSWPFAVGGIVLGAWLGTFLLIGGYCTIRRWIRQRLGLKVQPHLSAHPLWHLRRNPAKSYQIMSACSGTAAGKTVNIRPLRCGDWGYTTCCKRSIAAGRSSPPPSCCRSWVAAAHRDSTARRRSPWPISSTG